MAGEEEVGQHDAEFVGLGGEDAGEGFAQDGLGLRWLLLRGEESGFEHGAFDGLVGGQVGGQIFECAGDIGGAAGAEGAFAEDEDFVGTGFARVHFFTDLHNAGHVAGARGLVDEAIGNAFVLEGHEGGLPQEGGGFGSFAAVDGRAGLFDNGEGATGFEFTVERTRAEGGADDDGKDSERHGESPTSDPAAPTDRLVGIVEGIAGQLGGRLGCGIVFGCGHGRGKRKFKISDLRF